MEEFDFIHSAVIVFQAAKQEAQRWQEIALMQQQSQIPLQAITATLAPAQVETATHPQSSSSLPTPLAPFQAPGQSIFNFTHPQSGSIKHSSDKSSHRKHKKEDKERNTSRDREKKNKKEKKDAVDRESALQRGFATDLHSRPSLPPQN